MGILISIFLAKRLLESPSFRFALNNRQLSSDGYTVAEKEYQSMIGKTGITQTQLRPAGKIIIDDNQYDAVSQVSYIEKNEQVKVTGYNNGQLIVRKE